MGSPKGVDPVWLAQRYLRRQKYTECLKICSDILAANPYDQAVWYLKTRALTLQAWIDDSEVEEESVGELLLDDNAVAKSARPGTSLARPLTSAQGGSAISAAVRPMTGSGRPLTGFARPGTASARPPTGSTKPGTASLQSAFASNRPGTSRPVTSGGRLVRLGTASLRAAGGGPFIDLERLDLRKYASRPSLARALADYMLYCDRSPKRALELCAHATTATEYKDWWWKARLGKCYYQLGLFRDAEKQFLSSLEDTPMVTTTLELCKVYLRMDQPLAALDAYTKAAKSAPGEIALLVGAARVHEALNDATKSVDLYKQVLHLDAGCVEAIACLAAFHFYTDQPEIALRLFRRLLQSGVNNTELWNNLGLCCFHASQYDMALPCFHRALALAPDSAAPDVWYNISQVAVGIGDLALAYQALSVAVALDPSHAESLNNLGVLEVQKGDSEAAVRRFRAAQAAGEHMYEPFFNGALAALRKGNMQAAYQQALKSEAAFPEHAETQEVLKKIRDEFTML